MLLPALPPHFFFSPLILYFIALSHSFDRCWCVHVVYVFNCICLAGNSSYLDFTCYETWYGFKSFNIDTSGPEIDEYSESSQVKRMNRIRIKHEWPDDSEPNEKQQLQWI